ncbi:AraC family transcriptional regulator [Neolewinella litorea]|uniref:AraC family transcriptional regulator n=1 Tax=Neolewinella litorea TaxID=2562452 RepID=A0A4S4NNJ5_9BACT|nr:AraC family transcriptional regulator [Neolewinella litorea]THH39951.1 AraC family transcriptional regulator [Neolewinella litorea]
MLYTDHLRSSSLQTLVENRTTYTMDALELNLFETHEVASAVELRFDQPVLASMIRGRKIMHLRDQPGFAFLPGESVLLPAEERMVIDFPDATDRQPTKCLALAIDETEVAHVLQLMNERRPRADGSEWSATDYNFHFSQQPAITQLLQRLVFLCAEDHPSKDLFVQMHLRELLIRILQSESKHRHLRPEGFRPPHASTTGPLGEVITYVRNHLDDKLTVAHLSRLACMSESAFYRAFRNELDCSPVEFINNERLQLAASLLQDPTRSIRDVALRCGFNSVPYFTRLFGEQFGRSPGAYQAELRLASTGGR